MLNATRNKQYKKGRVPFFKTTDLPKKQQASRTKPKGLNHNDPKRLNPKPSRLNDRKCRQARSARHFGTSASQCRPVAIYYVFILCILGFKGLKVPRVGWLNLYFYVLGSMIYIIFWDFGIFCVGIACILRVFIFLGYFYEYVSPISDILGLGGLGCSGDVM